MTGRSAAERRLNMEGVHKVAALALADEEGPEPAEVHAAAYIASLAPPCDMQVLPSMYPGDDTEFGPGMWLGYPCGSLEIDDGGGMTAVLRGEEGCIRDARAWGTRAPQDIAEALEFIGESVTCK